MSEHESRGHSKVMTAFGGTVLRFDIISVLLFCHRLIKHGSMLLLSKNLKITSTSNLIEDYLLV